MAGFNEDNDDKIVTPQQLQKEREGSINFQVQKVVTKLNARLRNEPLPLEFLMPSEAITERVLKAIRDAGWSVTQKNKVAYHNLYVITAPATVDAWKIP